MNIVVCIKQVPDVDDIKWTKENNLDRSLMLSKINPQDDWVLDWAIKIKSQFVNSKLTVLSMGPLGAKRELEYALAKGADRAILLSDKAFAASDTLATSKILSCAIKKFIPDFNMILTGQMASDGDTAQVPVSISQLLDIVDVTNCVDIINADKNTALVKQKIGCTIDTLEAKTPCLIAIKAPCSISHTPKIEDYIRAQNKGYETYGLDEVGISKEETGILGSPTFVYKAFRPEIKKETKEISENTAQTLLNMVKEAQKV